MKYLSSEAYSTRDGCVYRKYSLYIQIQFKFASLSLLAYARQTLAKLGLHPTSITSDDTKFRFFLSRQAEVDRFFRVVKPKTESILDDSKMLLENSPTVHTHIVLEYRKDRNRPNLIATIL